MLSAFLLLLGCQDDTPQVVYVTEVIVFDDGEEVVITQAFTATPEAAAATPTPEAREIVPDPILLDIAQIRTFSIPDPQRTTNQEALDLVENLYIGLTNFNHRDKRVDPELAVSWGVSSDRLTWTFTLREDVFWVQAEEVRDTNLLVRDSKDALVGMRKVRAVSAEDMVYALQRACDPQTNAPHIFILFVIEGCERINRETGLTEEAKVTFGVQALDARTLEIKLTEKAPYFEAITTLPFFKPLPQDRIESDEFDWLDTQDFLASGPFVWSPRSEPERELNALAVLQKNDYWPIPLDVWNLDAADRKGNVQRMNIYEVDSRGEAFDLWDKNEIDLTAMPFSLSERFLDSPLRPPRLVQSQEVFYLGFNFDSVAFSIPEVRRAFSMAIDRERLIEEVYGRRGEEMKHFAPEGAVAAPKIDEIGVGFWANKAQQQLAASGYASCRGIGPIKYLIRDSDEALQHAESLIRMWVEALSCDPNQFEIEQVQFGKILANTRPNSSARPDLFDLGWSAFYPDAHNWYEPVLHCSSGENRPNRPCDINDETDMLLEAAAASFDKTFRAKAYEKAETLLFGEAGTFPIAPLYVRGDYVLRHGWVQKEEEREDQPTYDHTRWYPALFGGEQYETYWIDERLKEIERTQ